MILTPQTASRKAVYPLNKKGPLHYKVSPNSIGLNQKAYAKIIESRQDKHAHFFMPHPYRVTLRMPAADSAPPP